ncbi:hypothetical protein VP01_632g5 [Puccinia sorghi]|uniref:Uncharacterized protein n=1 Tax=Puccinia sorghi TaxID=27349 RepID=A0A0L6UIA3_9BASI|nr:hypothetical protein VP01_632g5 [Puccinia sorghi]
MSWEDCILVNKNNEECSLAFKKIENAVREPNIWQEVWYMGKLLKQFYTLKQSKPTTEPQPASQPIPEPLLLPEITLPPVAPAKVAQLASSLPADTTSSNDGTQSGLSFPSEATHRTIFHQSLPSKPAEAAPQSSNVPVKPFSFFFSSFGTPGPKICTRLPDDLIVPMSVPLPPSPNSPFVRVNNQAKVPQGSHRKLIRTQRSPRPRTKPTISRLDSATSAKNADKDNEHGGMPSTPTHQSRGQSPSDGGVGAHQQPVVQEGVLVDFDHEDTIWIPRPPALHQDLLQLANNLGMNQASDGEDRPQEKRARITAETTCSSADTTLSDSRVLCDESHKLPTSREHPPRRDPSMFHWDQPDLETDGDDSAEKTISCLKEEPPFFPDDVTVNEGTSFHTHFLAGLNPHDHSTPAASGGVPEVLSRRFELSEVSP